MLNFLISIVIFAVSVFLLGLSLRYGLKNTTRIDDYFSQKSNSNFSGFNWYYRIPFAVGVIPEYFYAMVLGNENYFNRNWWALKTSSFISILLFIAGLKSRSAVYAYFNLEFMQENGILGFFTSGNFVMFMNIIVLLYLALFVLICIESIKMHGIYAPLRILTYSILSVLMANLTIITISLIAFITVVYVIIKIIGFLFFSSSKRRRKDNDEESAGSILKNGFREFNTELYEWERKEKPINTNNNSNNTKRRKPKIRRVRKVKKSDDEIPRLYPD